MLHLLMHITSKSQVKEFTYGMVLGILGKLLRRRHLSILIYPLPTCLDKRNKVIQKLFPLSSNTEYGVIIELIPRSRPETRECLWVSVDLEVFWSWPGHGLDPKLDNICLSLCHQNLLWPQYQYQVYLIFYLSDLLSFIFQISSLSDI